MRLGLTSAIVIPQGVWVLNSVIISISGDYIVVCIWLTYGTALSILVSANVSLRNADVSNPILMVFEDG